VLALGSRYSPALQERAVVTVDDVVVLVSLVVVAVVLDTDVVVLVDCVVVSSSS